jgi:hypothetical protein
MHTVSTFPRTRRARRRQMAWGVLLWAAGAALFVLTVLASWRVGRSQVEIEILRLQADLAAQHELNRLLSVRAAAAEQQAEAAIARHAQLLQRQRSQAPSPELRHLTELAEEKLRAGVPVSRLEFVLGQAEIEPICDREIEIHRMTVQTASGPSPVASAGSSATA